MNERNVRSSTSILALVFVAGLILGGILTAYVSYRQISDLNSDISNLKSEVSKLWGNQVAPNLYNVSVNVNGTALSELYQNVKDSVVMIRGTTGSGTAQGSGFVFNFTGTMVVVTNNHVVSGVTNVSVTFSNGNGYAATVNGTDKYADLAALTVDAPEYEFKPLEITSSSTLKVGDPVIAIGNPYGLVGSMTTGVVSALGRTISEEEYTGGFSIANIIQTSAPINPGNSGGPLLDYYGKVVGITTAIVSQSQGLGFAVPSSAILREMQSLIVNGNYEGHSYFGLRGTDMDYDTAQQIKVNVTYGWRIVDYLNPSPARTYGVQLNDIFIALNGTRIKNSDDMSSYLEERTLPGEGLEVTVWRGTGNSQTETSLLVVLGPRP